MKTIVITISVFVVVILGFAIYYMLQRSSAISSKVSKKLHETFEDVAAPEAKVTSQSQPGIRVMLFYAKWCPHCERYLETKVYDSFDQAIKDDSTISYKVTFEKYDYDKNQELGDTYGITSFPTIIALDSTEKGANVYRFNGDRSNVQHIKKFLHAVHEKRSLSSNDYN